MATEGSDSPIKQDYQRNLIQIWCLLLPKEPEVAQP